MQTAVMGEMRTETETELDAVRSRVTDSRGLLKQNRHFLDYFWDIAKPERETRLRAVEKLIEHVQKSDQCDELKYTLKRLVDGLCHAREEARTGYSLALAQVLSVFDDVTLRSILDQIREKHNLQTASKKQIKHVTFGNFFGVLALSQSTRLDKEPDVLLECVKLLQSLSQYREYLRDLPRKTIADILNQVSEQMFEQVLFSALQEDLSSALRSPEQLELLLLVMRRFSSTLSPAHLDKLLGTASIINTHTLPRLVEVLKTAARSVKKECVLPDVASDLLHVSLREDTYTLFWDKVVIDGLISEPPGPCHYLAFRLMGVSLSLLSVSQLQCVLNGEVMRRYGEHVMTAQLPERFKFSPEMDECVCVFLRSCSDADRQLLVLKAFSQLTHRGAPVVPAFWKVLEQVDPDALTGYTHWLTQSFCKPELPELLEFSTRKQRRGRDSAHDSAHDSTHQTEECVQRFRKWIIHRLSCIVENQQIKKEEKLVMEITRFLFFHSFFHTLKSTPVISESQSKLSPPLDQKTRDITSSTFFSVLHSLSVMPVLGAECVQSEGVSRRSVLGVMTDGSMWVYGLVQFANTLLKQTKHIQSVHTLCTEHTQAWDSMLQSVESLSKKIKKSAAPEHSAFQHLLLIIGIQMFKAPDDSVELLNDLRSCMEQAQAKKSQKKTKKKSDADSQQAEGAEPHWVEVVVDILLSLLAQPSRLIRSVCKTAFSRVCPYLTQSALTAILNVLDPSKDEEESGVMVTDDNVKMKTKGDEEEEQEEEQEAADEEESDSTDNEEEEDEEMEEEEEVDQNFRLELMKVLQGQNALATEEDGSEDEELDDEAMMKLDENLASLFGEQKKKLQAKKDEKERLRKEKTLVRDFKIKVLDLLDVFLCKQGSSGLVLELVEPLLGVIENCMSSESGQHEQDFLRRAAHIFRNQLCRGKHYCREVEGREAELHDMLERLIGRAQKLSDSSVALYYFSAALYLVKVLRGAIKDTAESVMGKVDVERVTLCFKDSLTSFMKRRKSPLTGDMFIELFNRFPVLCVNLLDTAVESITGGVREHQQAQACVMVLRALPCKEVKQLLSETRWTEICQKTTEQLTQTLMKVEFKNKAVQEKMVKALELAHFLIKTVHHQKLEVKLENLRDTLKSMNADGSLQKAGKLEDTYWSVMKLFGLQKPKVEKVKKGTEDKKTEEEEEEEEEPKKKKKKGFLPESKKRKNRKKPVILEGKESGDTPLGGGGGGGGGEEGKKKRKNNKKKRRESETQNQPPAKKPKAQRPQRNKHKKERKCGATSSAE